MAVRTWLRYSCYIYNAISIPLGQLICIPNDRFGIKHLTYGDKINPLLMVIILKSRSGKFGSDLLGSRCVNLPKNGGYSTDFP